VLELLLQSRHAHQVHERLAGEPRFHVPHLMDLEVAQVLRRYVRRGDVQAERAEQALALFRGFPLERYPHHLFLPRIAIGLHRGDAVDART
jgi:predicted nucleic acid-binding protein